MEKLTAVEWLESKLYEHEFDDPIYRATQCGWFDKAKEMERNQMDIPDDEIIKEAINHSSKYTLNGIPRNVFIIACQWYKDKIKKQTS